MVQQQKTLVYPVMKGIRDEVPRIVNRVFIMWTRLGHTGSCGYQNHFVPVKWPATVVTGTIDLMSDNSPGKPHPSSCLTAATETFSQNQQPATTGELTPIPHCRNQSDRK